MTAISGTELTPRIQIRTLDESNRAAVMKFMGAWVERPRNPEFAKWRYRDCPTLQVLAAMVGDECIGTISALRRIYHTSSGDRECLEPFEWHSSVDWRAQAPGLRLVRQLMRGTAPIITVAGTDSATGLLMRLKWTAAGVVTRYALPLTGRYLTGRGRGTLVSRIFDIVGRPFFTPSRVRGTQIHLEPATEYTSEVTALTEGQRRFALMRKPDDNVIEWLQRAPADVGRYFLLHARIGNELVGWVTARVFPMGTILVGELLEVFLDDERRAQYPAIVAEASAMLAGYNPDVLLCTTNCANTTAALRRLRFRPDDSRPVFMWWGNEAAPAGDVLVDGAISDHSFFPVSSAHDPSWLSPPGGE